MMAMKSFVHNRFFALFGFSIVTTLALVTLVGFTLGMAALVTMLILTMLEVTFSLDNAVVNAQVLRHMNPFWQRMFMTIGIIIAVFGMRLFMPLLVVSLTAGLGFGGVINLALHDPAKYAADLAAAHPVIAAFGGMFLLMIFFEYVLSTKAMPVFLRGTGRYIGLIFAIIILTIMCFGASQSARLGIFYAGLYGLVGFLAIRLLDDWFVQRSPTQRMHGVQAHGGLITFLYLEMLDASFSFDGVIGAFAITTNVVLIAAGLGAGAVWVRSITIGLVRHNTLEKYPYLDLGAHLAIGSLATFLLVSISYDLPDLLTGTTGLGVIFASFLASVLRNRQLAKTAV